MIEHKSLESMEVAKKNSRSLIGAQKHLQQELTNRQLHPLWAEWTSCNIVKGSCATKRLAT